MRPSLRARMKAAVPRRPWGTKGPPAIERHHAGVVVVEIWVREFAIEGADLEPLVGESGAGGLIIPEMRGRGDHRAALGAGCFERGEPRPVEWHMGRAGDHVLGREILDERAARVVGDLALHLADFFGREVGPDENEVFPYPRAPAGKRGHDGGDEPAHEAHARRIGQEARNAQRGAEERVLQPRDPVVMRSGQTGVPVLSGARDRPGRFRAQGASGSEAGPVHSLSFDTR